MDSVITDTVSVLTKLFCQKESEVFTVPAAAARPVLSAACACCEYIFERH